MKRSFDDINENLIKEDENAGSKRLKVKIGDEEFLMPACAFFTPKLPPITQEIKRKLSKGVYHKLFIDNDSDFDIFANFNFRGHLGLLFNEDNLISCFNSNNYLKKLVFNSPSDSVTLDLLLTHLPKIETLTICFEKDIIALDQMMINIINKYSHLTAIRVKFKFNDGIEGFSSKLETLKNIKILKTLNINCQFIEPSASKLILEILYTQTLTSLCLDVESIENYSEDLTETKEWKSALINASKNLKKLKIKTAVIAEEIQNEIIESLPLLENLQHLQLVGFDVSNYEKIINYITPYQNITTLDFNDYIEGLDIKVLNQLLKCLDNKKYLTNLILNISKEVPEEAIKDLFVKLMDFKTLSNIYIEYPSEIYFNNLKNLSKTDLDYIMYSSKNSLDSKYMKLYKAALINEENIDRQIYFIELFDKLNLNSTNDLSSHPLRYFKMQQVYNDFFEFKLQNLKLNISKFTLNHFADFIDNNYFHLAGICKSFAQGSAFATLPKDCIKLILGWLGKKSLWEVKPWSKIETINNNDDELSENNLSLTNDLIVNVNEITNVNPELLGNDTFNDI